MPRPAIQVDGARQLRASLKRAGLDVQDLKDAHRVIADQVLRAAEPPRLTGRLAASGRASGTARESLVRWGRKSVPYAGPIYWGWEARNIAPNQWAEPAIANTESARNAVLLDALEQIIDRIEGAPGL